MYIRVSQIPCEVGIVFLHSSGGERWHHSVPRRFSAVFAVFEKRWFDYVHRYWQQNGSPSMLEIPFVFTMSGEPLKREKAKRLVEDLVRNCGVKGRKIRMVE